MPDKSEILQQLKTVSGGKMAKGALAEALEGMLRSNERVEMAFNAGVRGNINGNLIFDGYDVICTDRFIHFHGKQYMVMTFSSSIPYTAIVRVSRVSQYGTQEIVAHLSDGHTFGIQSPKHAKLIDILEFLESKV